MLDNQNLKWKKNSAVNSTPNEQNFGLCQWLTVTHKACLSSARSLRIRSAWYRGQYPLHQTSPLCQQAGHTAFAHDALRVSSMNLSYGRNQNHDMRDGWKPLRRSTAHAHTSARSEGSERGEVALEERGPWRHGKLRSGASGDMVS